MLRKLSLQKTKEKGQMRRCVSANMARSVRKPSQDDGEFQASLDYIQNKIYNSPEQHKEILSQKKQTETKQGPQ